MASIGMLSVGGELHIFCSTETMKLIKACDTF